MTGVRGSGSLVTSSGAGTSGWPIIDISGRTTKEYLEKDKRAIDCFQSRLSWVCGGATHGAVVAR